MFVAKRTPREDMERAWRKGVAPPPSDDPVPPPRALNLQATLDLGNMIFFTFRGRPYGIPPLSMTDGEEILDCWLEIQTFGNEVTQDNIHPYFRTFRRLADLLWQACRPVGRLRRLLRRLHLHGNPFRKATEGELIQLAVFMLGRRTSAHLRWPETAGAQNHGTY